MLYNGHKQTFTAQGKTICYSIKYIKVIFSPWLLMLPQNLLSLSKLTMEENIYPSLQPMHGDFHSSPDRTDSNEKNTDWELGLSRGDIRPKIQMESEREWDLLLLLFSSKQSDLPQRAWNRDFPSHSTRKWLIDFRHTEYAENRTLWIGLLRY